MSTATTGDDPTGDALLTNGRNARTKSEREYTTVDDPQAKYFQSEHQRMLQIRGEYLAELETLGIISSTQINRGKSGGKYKKHKLDQPVSSVKSGLKELLGPDAEA
jgi:Cdc6-like AAA superfamily ATPase